MFRCPTKDDLFDRVALPRGRAWQTHEGGPSPATPFGQFWLAAAEVFAFVAKRACDLRSEFWCATHSETHDQWMTEYGLPDACDPFPDLCTKVAAIGGTRCEYYAAIAARAGWSIRCIEEQRCGARAGCARAGNAQAGRRRGGVMKIVVDLGASFSYVGPRSQPPRAGRFRAGWRLGCPPDIGPLECLLARVVHAEILIVYEVTNG
ncbi:hypothetical protein RPPS3_25830 [Rhodopseudomonas palustris]|uniref:hypothetical protein n=1 Tax=Rhodopseudomonas palustris TaxID=1076 RepID=UPI000D1B18F7|nr:hypothetical protein [Rhodopseudomonas palustris]AVT76646.1 hypothetical protein RPPS3_25830 [Rhodopseudomonas palustris]